MGNKFNFLLTRGLGHDESKFLSLLKWAERSHIFLGPSKSPYLSGKQIWLILWPKPSSFRNTASNWSSQDLRMIRFFFVQVFKKFESSENFPILIFHHFSWFSLFQSLSIRRHFRCWKCVVLVLNWFVEQKGSVLNWNSCFKKVSYFLRFSVL